jgi:hypothetical protein
VSGLLPVVRYADPLLWITGYIRAALVALGKSDVRVSDRYDETNTDRAVWVLPTGGHRLTVVTATRRFGINIYAPGPTGQPVNTLAEDVRSALAACPGSGAVKAYTELSAPVPIDDPNGIPRRYMTCEIVIKGA